MSVEVHLEWEGVTHLVGVLHTATRGTSVTFEYQAEWLTRPAAFAIDPTNLPLRPGPHHGVYPDWDDLCDFVHDTGGRLVARQL
jgi:hypothetical protein